MSHERGVSCSVHCSALGLTITFATEPLPFEALLSLPGRGQEQHFRRTSEFYLSYLAADGSLTREQLGLLDDLQRRIEALEQDLDPRSLATFLDSLVPEHEDVAPPDSLTLAAPGREPRTATVKLSRRCNLNCSFCKERRWILQRHLDRFVQVQRLLEQLRDQGFDSVNFDGGEAALSPLLPDAIRHATRVGFTRVQVITNGIRFADRRFLERLHRAGLNAINVSLHAVDHETALAIYGRDPTSQQRRALENIHCVTPDIELTINTVLVEANRVALARLLEQAVAYEPRTIIVIFCLLNYLPDQLRNVRLASLDDGQVLRVVQDFLAHHHVPLRLRHFPFCKVPSELWGHMQGRGKRPANATWHALHVLQAPNRRLCPRCAERQECHFPLLAYLLQHQTPWELAVGGLMSLAGVDVLSRRFREGRK